MCVLTNLALANHSKITLSLGDITGFKTVVHVSENSIMVLKIINCNFITDLTYLLQFLFYNSINISK